MKHRDEAWLEQYAKRTGLDVPGVTRAAPQPAPIEKSESNLQTRVVQHLQQSGITVWQMYRGSARGGSVWATKGIPDLYLPSWGWIELKTESGAISIEQHRRHEELRAENQRIIVPTSLEDVIRAVMGGK